MTVLTQGLCQYRYTKQSPHTLSVRKLILNFPCTQLAWSTLFSQVRADPGESLQRVFCLCDLLGKLLCSSCHVSLPPTGQPPELLGCETGSFPSKVSPPAHIFSIDVPRQPRIAQTSCLAAYFAQFLPAFPQWRDCSPALLFYRMGRRLPLHFIDHIDLYLRNFKEESPTSRKVLWSQGSESHTLIQQASATSLVPCEVRAAQYRVEETTKQESKRSHIRNTHMTWDFYSFFSRHGI